MKALRNIVPYLIAAILLSWLMYVVLTDKENLELIKKVEFSGILISVIICLVMFILNGAQIAYLVRKDSSIGLHTSDFLLLPASMNLWSYILPFRGGLIYSATYLNLKYNLKMSSGFSIGLYTFALSTSIGGAFGLLMCAKNDLLISWISLISFLLLISPIALFVLKKWTANWNNSSQSLLGKLGKFMKNTLEGYGSFLNDFKTGSSITLLILLGIIVYIFWVYWTVRIFQFNLDYFSVIILALVLRLSVIARFIPGNLGIQELISGATTSLLSGDMSAGIVVALFIRLTALVIAVILGGLSFFQNMDTFKTDSFISLWRKFRDY